MTLRRNKWISVWKKHSKFGVSLVFVMQKDVENKVDKKVKETKGIMA